MNAEQAANLTRALHPRLAVPMHYAYTGGPVRDRLLLKMDRDPQLYAAATAAVAPDTAVHILSTGQPLTL